MELTIRTLAFVSIFSLAGCATQGVNSTHYTAPVQAKIANEATVQKQNTQVWDGLVKEISKSFYVINNIDKESRIINISFSTNTPSDYVDCGFTERTYTQGNNVEKFDYRVAGKSRFKMAGDQQPHPAWASYAIVVREPSLEGRMNIYVAPAESDKNSTQVTVNTRYIWTVKVKGEMYNEHANRNTVFIGNIPESTSNTMFNTNTTGEYDAGKGTIIKCVSTGKLENEILGLLKK
ncbi:hypothetical protein E4633_11845 [Geomonas terrae]|uniref:Lipoprotein n=1 Tax=Geomonas terrae TaxID=2562681 RepID=A0A4S1CDG6_9BACT|nr:hypothetical protein [Geomonas terrae]TGU71036.1 hypothetical protein E4633_11845 [Geomonas terrae]